MIYKEFCSPRERFINHEFLKENQLTRFLTHVGPLLARAFGCYSVLITLLFILNKVDKAIKVLLFKLVTQSCNVHTQLNFCIY